MDDDKPIDFEEVEFRGVADHYAERWEEEYERGRGILTDTDRQFLRNVKDYDSRQVRSERRRTIRDRFRNGILDLKLLRQLDERTRGKLFEELQEQAEYGEMRAALSALIYFLYVEFDGDTEWIEGSVEYGIRIGDKELDTADRFGHRRVDVDIDIEPPYNLDRIESQLEAGNTRELSPAEIGVLVREGRVDPEDLEDLNLRE